MVWFVQPELSFGFVYRMSLKTPASLRICSCAPTKEGSWLCCMHRTRCALRFAWFLPTPFHTAQRVGSWYIVRLGVCVLQSLLNQTEELQ